MEAIAQRIKKTSGSRSRHTTARCAGIAHQSSSRSRGLYYTKRRSWVPSSNGTENSAKAFSFLNTRSDFLTVALVPALLGAPSAALVDLASSASVAARPTRGDDVLDDHGIAGRIHSETRHSTSNRRTKKTPSVTMDPKPNALAKSAAVIEFRGPAVGVAGNSLSGFKSAVIFQKIRDACRSEGVR
jgi:hypothetical protein